jgi:hypothetical protein
MSYEGIPEDIEGLLIQGEQVLGVAEQDRFVPGGSTTTPNEIYVTNFRIIFRNPSWWGLKSDIQDMNFRDIANVSLKNGLFSTELHITTRWNGDEITIPALATYNAQYIHSLIQKGIRRSGIGEVLI